MVFDIAEALAYCENASLAIKYYRLLRDLPGGNDAAVSLQLGRCYIMKGESAIAEEYLLAAIDADQDNIEARIELANMYEKAREEEEALILAAEAMALREAQGQDVGGGYDPSNQQMSRSNAQIESRLPRRRDGLHQREQRKLKLNTAAVKGLLPRRYRPKRLAGADKRRKEEQARALKLTEQYEVVRRLRQQINDGREDLLSAWMASSKELVDDFRSLKKFYTWEKYLHFLGSKSTIQQSETDQPKNELSQMYERLARSKFAIKCTSILYCSVC